MTDPRVARRAFRVADRFGATPREMLALAMAGLVESNFTHLTGGDRDSTGFLQQRPSQGWGPIGESVARDTRQFLRAARRVEAGGFSGGAGALAQAVQRSAFPGRYGERRADARALLSQFAGGGGGAGGGGAPAQGMPALPSGPSAGSSLPGGSGSTLALLEALQGAQRAPGPPSGGLAAPAHSAAPVMPQGLQAAVSGGGPAARPDTAALMAAVRTMGEGMPGVAGGGLPGGLPGGGGQQQAGQPAGGGGGRLGKVTVAPGADRAGVSTNRAVIRFARRVAGIAGMPVTIGTGTNHSQMTVNGNVSQHWTGDAADIPATGKTLLKLGRAALIAAGMPRAQARKAKGGLYNVGGRQIIFLTNEGGDHFDHLHIGL